MFSKRRETLCKFVKNYYVYSEEAFELWQCQNWFAKFQIDLGTFFFFIEKDEL